MANYYSSASPAAMGFNQPAHPSHYAGMAAPMPLGYGSLDGAQLMAAKGQAFQRGSRRRVNAIAVLMSLFVPCIMFTLMFGAMSFSLHYHQPSMAYLVVAMGFVGVIAIGVVAGDAARKKAANDPRADPSWYAFMFLSCLAAWMLGVCCGDVNFFGNMQPFYDIKNLNTYPAVDPSRMKGQQLMDAGQFHFIEGARLDLHKSMGFKNLDSYCVAPVSVGDENATKELANYDFWAVGVNCCSGNSGEFHCPFFNDPQARAGLRLMRDDQRAFFRLAVQQAEATYRIRSTHPLFLYWMQDPTDTVAAYENDGFKFFLVGMFAFFAFQLFLVVVATIVFSKMA